MTRRLSLVPPSTPALDEIDRAGDLAAIGHLERGADSVTQQLRLAESCSPRAITPEIGEALLRLTLLLSAQREKMAADIGVAP